MKELQKKFVNIGLAAPYNIPVNVATGPQQQLSTSAAAQHLNQIQMQNYLLSGLQLQNSSGKGKSPAKPVPVFQLIKQNQQKLQFSDGLILKTILFDKFCFTLVSQIVFISNRTKQRAKH